MKRDLFSRDEIEEMEEIIKSFHYDFIVKEEDKHGKNHSFKEGVEFLRGLLREHKHDIDLDEIFDYYEEDGVVDFKFILNSCEDEYVIYTFGPDDYLETCKIECGEDENVSYSLEELIKADAHIGYWTAIMGRYGSLS